VTRAATAAKRGAGRLTALLGGFLTFAGLHVLFVLAWDRFFAGSPWPGYEASARLGLVEPWFVNSPRSLWLTRAAFFAAAFSVGIGRRSGRWPRAALLWAGGAAALVATYATTSMPALPAGELGFLLYPLRLFLPIVLGTALGELARHSFLTPPDAAGGAGA
jgi:hypothetical protein